MFPLAGAGTRRGEFSDETGRWSLTDHQVVFQAGIFTHTRILRSFAEGTVLGEVSPSEIALAAGTGSAD